VGRLYGKKNALKSVSLTIRTIILTEITRLRKRKEKTRYRTEMTGKQLREKEKMIEQNNERQRGGDENSVTAVLSSPHLKGGGGAMQTGRKKKKEMPRVP